MAVYLTNYTFPEEYEVHVPWFHDTHLLIASILRVRKRI